MKVMLTNFPIPSPSSLFQPAERGFLSEQHLLYEKVKQQELLQRLKNLFIKGLILLFGVPSRAPLRVSYFINV